jgi:hypothetical protein
MISLFDPVINQVIGLVEAQVKEAKKMNRTIEVSINSIGEIYLLISIANHSSWWIWRLTILVRKA